MFLCGYILRRFGIRVRCVCLPQVLFPPRRGSGSCLSDLVFAVIRKNVFCLFFVAPVSPGLVCQRPFLCPDGFRGSRKTAFSERADGCAAQRHSVGATDGTGVFRVAVSDSCSGGYSLRFVSRVCRLRSAAEIAELLRRGGDDKRTQGTISYRPLCARNRS